MANTIKYTTGGPDIDNKVTVPFNSIGQDGSGQGSQGTRTFLSPNHVRIVDVNSNTRQFHLIQDLTPGKEYTVSVEYLKITGAPTFRFQIQGYTNNTYRRTIKFTNTVETGLKDIDGWQTARSGESRSDLCDHLFRRCSIGCSAVRHNHRYGFYWLQL